MKKVRNVKALLFTVCLIFAVSALFTGCASKKSINVTGSTSVGPLVEDLAAEYAKENPDIKIDVQQVGSSTGVKSANDGSADIGMASRDLKGDETGWGLTEHVIARDAIAIVIHPSNPVADLTKETAAKIFTGEIKNWKDVGGPDKEIIVVSREAGSGTRGAFEEILGVEDKVIDNALIADGNGAVRANVAGKDGSIGYMSLGMIDDSVKPVKIEGVDPTSANVLSGDYKIARPFLMLTKGDLKPEVKEFLDFIMSTKGQEVVAEEYIPVK